MPQLTLVAGEIVMNNPKIAIRHQKPDTQDLGQAANVGINLFQFVIRV